MSNILIKLAILGLYILAFSVFFESIMDYLTVDDYFFSLITYCLTFITPFFHESTFEFVSNILNSFIIFGVWIFIVAYLAQ